MAKIEFLIFIHWKKRLDKQRCGYVKIKALLPETGAPDCMWITLTLLSRKSNGIHNSHGNSHQHLQKAFLVWKSNQLHTGSLVMM